ncbi:MAG: FtsQ-type POTRA domain-containing protein [Butyrivibrio sp.]|jgi:cell division protein FtsQ|nr:FtsQ-type POTRA domain-containing protein [Butyrivibrio sp.]
MEKRKRKKVRKKKKQAQKPLTDLFLVDNKYKKTRKVKKKRPRRQLDVGAFIRESWRLHKSIYIITGIIIAIIIFIAIAADYVLKNYTITNIYVDGNTHYTDEEIVNMVMVDKLDHNSLYLSLKYQDKSITDIPFIEKMDVNIVSPDTIRINVYEKAIAGYISYLGRYMYFDRDGIIVESSLETTDGVSEVMGLDFNSVVLYQRLPIDNADVFEEILDITQLLSKYNLNADKIFFDKDYNVYLYFDDVEVTIGTNSHIDEKIIQLQYILPKLEGKSGILDMEDYDGTSKNIIFQEKN